jgi:hypothetical protein
LTAGREAVDDALVMDSPPPTPGTPSPRSSPRRCALAAWAGWALSVALLWVEHRLGVLHPWSHLFLLLLVVTVLAAACGLAAGLWRAVRGPGRRAAAAWALACLVPAGLWAALGAYLLHLQRAGNFPTNLATTVARRAVASLMELQARYAYPYRIEGERLVMFHDGRVTEPQRDLEAMERHVGRLEELTGRPLRAKIHWVRGSLLGQGRMAVAGLALGSATSPADWDTADHPYRLSEDRHELAHAVIHQQQPAGTDAPTLLVEGWAEAHNGMTPHKRAEFARHSRELWRERTDAGPGDSYLRELTGPGWYYRIDGPVYNVGGALADFLLRKYGTEKFLRLYYACRPDRFEEACALVLGAELDGLEAEFWAEVERLAGGPNPAD